MGEGQDKRTFMAIGLIMLVTFAWIYLSPKSPPPVKPLPKIQKTEEVKEEAVFEKKTKFEPEKVVRPSLPESLKSFENKLYKVTFSNYGAVIKSLELKKYRDRLGKNSKAVDMFDLEGDSIVWNFTLDKMEFNSDIPFELVSTGKDSITYKGQLIASSEASSTDEGANIADVLVTYKMSDEDYQVTQLVEIINKTNNELSCSSSMNLYGKTNEVTGSSFGFFSAREEPVKAIYNLNDKIERETLDKQAESVENYTGDIKWLGFNDKYFMTALIPDIPSVRSFKFLDKRDDLAFFDDGKLLRTDKISGSDANVLRLDSSIPKSMESADYKIERQGEAVLSGSRAVIVEEASGCFGKKQSVVLDIPKDFKLIDNLFCANIQYPSRKLKAGDKLEYGARIFAGPKEISMLKKAGRQMDRAIDLGDWIGPISRPLLYFLKWLYSIIPNYGIAIILLTIIVRGLMFPLTHMQNKSMKKMQMLKPEMDKLKAKFGKDKESLNREMMKLWKIHKVNPMGGCFPLILQLPIFFALYRVLYNSIELRHEPFMFWIRDLSNYDPYFVTPLLMGISFYLQQKIMPQTTMDAAQQKMMKVMMPIMFTMLMLFLPSGLVLYIFVSTLLGIIQQYINMRSKDTVLKA